MTWNDYFDLAKDYYEENGNLAIPQKYETQSGVKLGIWINTQRRAYKGTSKSKINEMQIKQLESIGMIWEAKKASNNVYVTWMYAYSKAKSYFGENGDLLVPFEYSTCDGYHLGYWISEQRGKYKHNKLNEEQINLLNNIGMVWQIRGEFNWQKCFESARKYFKVNGNLLVPEKYIDENGIALGVWIINQRVRYKNYNKSTFLPLTEEQIRQLESIGMVWSVKQKRTWEFYYEYALQFYEQHLTLCIPVNYEIEGIKLGSWIANQRRLRKADKLSKYQIDLLDNIEMIWEVKSRNSK